MRPESSSEIACTYLCRGSLDESFRAWGEGDREEVTSVRRTTRRAQLAAIYLPQYRMGHWEMLPYSPLSLDAVVEASGRHAIVQQRTSLISDCDQHSVAKILRIVADTLRQGAPQLNRVCYDVLAFIAAFVSIRDRDLLDEACAAIGVKFDAMLARINGALSEAFAIETEPGASWPDLWLSWLDAVTSTEVMAYLPSHIVLACMTEEDWSADTRRGEGPSLQGFRPHRPAARL